MENLQPKNVPAPDFVKLSAIEQIPHDYHNFDAFFGEMLTRAMEKLTAAGYSFKYGIELDFELKKPEDIIKRYDKWVSNGQYIGPNYIPSLKIAQQIDTLKDDVFIREAIEKIRNFLNDDNNAAITLAEKVNNTIPAMREHFEEFVENYNSGDEDEKHHGLQNIFLAYIHLFPVAQGGLSDIIEPRFGAYQHGLGWWDGRDDAEVRTNILDNVPDVLFQYHRIRESFYATAAKFGLVAEVYYIPVQLHVSLWKNGKNLMLLQDDESVETCEKVMHGYYLMIDDNTHFFQNLSPHQLYEKDAPSASGDRTALLRQMHDNWEIRKYSTTHNWNIARDLAMFVAAAGYGIFGPETLDDMKERLDVVISKVQKPLVKHLLSAPRSGLQSSLEHSEIREDGTINLSRAVAEYNHERMLYEIGEENAGAFTFTEPKTGHVFNLKTPEIWCKLFNEINDDAGNLDFTQLPEALQEAFSLLKGVCRRPVFQSEELTVASCIPQYLAALQGNFENKTLGFYFAADEQEALNRQLIELFQNALEQEARKHIDFQVFQLKREIDLENKAEEADPEKVETFREARERIKERYSANVYEPAHDIMRAYLCRGTQVLERRNEEGGRDGPPAIGLREDFAAGFKGVTGLLRPHFKEAVAGHISAAQADITTGNRLMSDLFELEKFFDEDAYNMKTFSENVYVDWVSRILANVKNETKGPHDIAVVSVHAMCEVYGLFDVFVFDRTVSMADIRKQIRECRQLAEEQFASAEIKFAEDLQEPRCRVVYADLKKGYFEALDDSIARADMLLDPHEWEAHLRDNPSPA